MQSSIPAVANRWSARKFWWSVEKFGHYLQFLCLLYCFIIFWFIFVSPTQDRWQFLPYYVESNFILIKWNFYDHYFIDVCTFLKKFMLVVRGIQHCEFSGPWGPNGWRPLFYTVWQLIITWFDHIGVLQGVWPVRIIESRVQTDLGPGLYEQWNSKVQKTGTINSIFHDPHTVWNANM